MKPCVSVIVPVYKVEDVLLRCLEGLCRQSLTDIEIILVDDASPDRCGEICEQYAAKDSRFKVAHHKENRGLSAARNTGIGIASADYLMFVDSDDFVHPDFCKDAYACALRQQADLVIFRYENVEKTECFQMEVTESEVTSASGYKTQTEALDLLLDGRTGVGQTAWNKLYRKELFRTISYPDGYLYEDVGTTYKAVLLSSGIYYLDKVLYYKCAHAGSITTLRMKKALQDWFAMFMQQYRDLAAWGYPKEKLELLLFNIAMGYCIKKKRDMSDSNYAYCEKALNTTVKIPEGFTVTWKRKALLVLFKYCPPLFELICALWGRKWDD